MDTMDTGFEEFFGAFEGEDGNQTDTPEETTEPETTEEVSEEPAEETTEEPDGDETAEEETEEEAEKDGAEGDGDSENKDSEQKFTIKVNKETREVGIAEMTELAQKGADYDRVKGQLETTRKNEQNLQAELDKQKPFMEFLTMAAEQAETTMEQLVENLHVNLLKSKGMTEAEARAEIRAAKAEKQVQNLTQQKQTAEKQPEAEDGMARAEKDLAEFRSNFPDVPLTEELLEKLMPDIRKGASMTNAYRKMKDAEKDAEIAELKRKLDASAQNKKNRAKAPGSQRDSGGQHKKDAFDDFFDAFEK